MVYEEFFKWYPYCYGYWKKYSDLEKKNGFLDKCENVIHMHLRFSKLHLVFNCYFFIILDTID